MANIFDYMAWRDIDLRKVEFNEIDNLILARLSYFPFDKLLKEHECITIKDAYERYLKSDNDKKILWDADAKLFEVLANSVRFGNVKVTEYINKIDNVEEKQFSAITVILPDKTIYVSFRGTDNTIVGWKENANMSFTDLVPAQLDSVKYLEYVTKRIKGKIRIGGHSKGGNLAVYAAAFCNYKIQKRIIKVYNIEGPGFVKRIIESPEYKNILGKVHRYIPQSSVIGRLLNSEETTTVVKSNQVGLMQHDIYSWEILGDKFIETEPTNSSVFIDKTISNWLEEVSNEQRAEFFDCLFEILYATKAETMQDIGSRLYSNSKIMIKTYQNLSQETKEMIHKTLSMLFKIGKENIEFPKINIKIKKRKIDKKEDTKKELKEKEDINKTTIEEIKMQDEEEKN